MKKLRIIIVWSVFCILIECLVLLYIDKIMFRHSSDFTVTAVSKDDDLNDEYETEVSSEASKITSSFNGRYISYFENNKFFVIDMKESEKKQVFEDENNEVLCAKWLPDRNIIVVAIKEKDSNNNNIISFKNYDAKNAESKNISKICSYENDMTIDDIATTTLSGVSYVAVGRKNNTSIIYRIDINEEIRKVTTKAKKVGSMDIFPHEDTLVYEDEATNRYYSYSNNKTNRIDLSKYGNVILLSVDNSGNVYMGQIQNDKISNVVYGNYKEKTSTWNSKKLNDNKPEKDIYINSSEQIVVNEGSKVINLDTKEEINYFGELLEIKDNVVCSKKGNVVYVKRI